jgi:hypothetical protein
MRISVLLWTTTALVLAACASQGVYLSEKTLMLGEVMHILTPTKVAQGELESETKVKNLSEGLHEQGITDEEVQEGRVVVLRMGIYWYNTASGITHNMLWPALVPKGIQVSPGNVVEGTAGDYKHAHTITRVRAKNLRDGQCYYQDLPTGFVKDLMGAISLIGPSGAATLYCKGIENEGWARPRSYWHKSPTNGAAPGQ